MKKIHLIFLIVLGTCYSMKAQNVGINATGATPDASAMLDVSSPSKGLLVPRVSLTATNAAGPVSSPTASLLVYNTATAGTAPNNVVPGYYFWNGSAWVQLLATTSTGNVGIGKTTPTEALDVAGNFRLSGALMPNNSAGTSGYILQSSGSNSAPTWISPSSLVSGSGWAFNGNSVSSLQSIGTTSNYDLPFITNNAEQMRLTSTGKLGIGKISPTEALDVNGNFNLSGALMPNNSAGTSGYILQSSGSNSAPTWISPSSLVSGSGWAFNGNSVSSLQSIGTTSNYDLPFITNNAEQMRLTSTGKLGIGKTSPTEALDVNGNFSLSGALMPNNSAGTSGYILQSSGSNSAPTWISPSSLVSGSGWAFNGNSVSSIQSIGTTSNYDLPFITNNAEQMRLTSTGKLGIGKTSPTEALDVAGNFRLSGALMPNNSAGTSGYILQSSGSNSAPTWISPSSLVGGSGWAFNGNSVSSIQSIGTTSNYDLPFITNNAEQMRLTSTGRLGLGSNAFDATNPEKFLVDGGSTTSYNLMTGKGNIDNYLQINIKNSSNGTNASSDLVATSNNGSETTNYIDMGINSGGYSNTTFPVLGGANTAYLYATGNDFVIGNGTSAKPIRLFTGGFSAANERMRIDGAGKVGIGTTTPTEALDITGNLRFSGALMPNNTAGTSGYILQSNGAGTSPTWVAPSAVAGSTNWTLNGNSVTALKSFGTTSNFDLPFITNNTEQMRLTTTGSLGLGSNSFDATNPEKLLVDGGTTSSYNLMTGKASIDNYLQINIKNNSNGANASSDIVATSNNGSESTNYIDMGINSGGYTNTSFPVLGGVNTAYLYTTGSDFVIGNGTTGKPIRFFTGGFSNSNERMRIDATGKVGIGKTSPTEALDVTGNFRFSGALMPNNAAGTSGYVLQSNGSGAAPTWVAPSVVAGAANWTLSGNNVTAEKTFGTTSNFDLPFITNSTEQMRITTTGSIGIGTSDLSGGEKVLIDAASTQTALSMIGNINDYLEMNVQNTSNGTLASSDIVATANNGTENSVYVDLGINSAGYSNGNSNILNGANVAYLYANANDFKIGNGSPSKDLVFFTNPVGGVLGTNTANGLERMRITSAGYVGIGTNNPSHLLHLGADDAVKPGGGSWSTASDRRLKKDIVAFKDGLSVLQKINPVSFKYNGMAGLPNDGKSYVGIIAQDMQEAAPYTIGTFHDDATQTDYLSYNPNAVTYILINAVKEQQATIDLLKKQLDEQNQRLIALENKLK
jgi:hypothetical protein